MLYQFVGNGKDDPHEITAFGHKFVLNGDPVEVSDFSKIAGNNHFRPVQEKLEEDKNNNVSLARDQLLAEAEALGIKVHHKAGAAKISEMIAEAKDGKAE